MSHGVSSNFRSMEHKYVAYYTLRSFYFMGAIWLFYYRLFLSDFGIGILDMVTFSAGLLLEVPSGAIADNFGRKRTVITGLIVSGAGTILQGFATSYLHILIGNMLTMGGWALCSGADEALFYHVLGDKAHTVWKRVLSRAVRFGLFATLIGHVSSSAVYAIDPGLPFIFSGSLSLFAIIPLLFVYDDRKYIGAEKLHGARAYLADIKIGIMTLFHEQLRRYTAVIVVVQGLYVISSYGMLRIMLAGRFGYTSAEMSWVVGSSTLLAITILWLQQKYESKIPDRRAIRFFILGSIGMVLLAIGLYRPYALVVMLWISVGEYALSPWISHAIHTYAPPSRRATVVSAASLLKTMPYVVLAPLIGYANIHQKLWYFLAAYAAALIITFVYFSRKKPVMASR